MLTAHDAGRAKCKCQARKHRQRVQSDCWDCVESSPSGSSERWWLQFWYHHSGRVCNGPTQQADGQWLVRSVIRSVHIVLISERWCVLWRLCHHPSHGPHEGELDRRRAEAALTGCMSSMSRDIVMPCRAYSYGGVCSTSAQLSDCWYTMQMVLQHAWHYLLTGERKVPDWTLVKRESYALRRSPSQQCLQLAGRTHHDLVVLCHDPQVHVGSLGHIAVGVQENGLHGASTASAWRSQLS